MPKPNTHRLGDLQLRILEVLWKQDEAPVSAVHDICDGFCVMEMVPPDTLARLARCCYSKMAAYNIRAW